LTLAENLGPISVEPLKAGNTWLSSVNAAPSSRVCFDAFCLPGRGR